MLTPEQLLELLRSLPERIPDYALVSREQLRKIRRAGYDMHVELERELLSTVDTSELVQGALRKTPEELRQARDEAMRWESAEDMMRVVLRGLTTANAIRRKRIADALQFAAGLSSAADLPELAPHVENIRRIRKRKRGK